MAEGQPASPGALHARLRTAAVLALSAAFLFVPIEWSYRPHEDVRFLLLGWGIHTLLASAALVASFLPLGDRAIDRFVLGLILGYVGNAYIYFVTLRPHDPALVAIGLTCLLFLGPVFFGWSERRTAGVAAVTWIGFAVVATRVPLDHPAGPPVAVALAALVVGAGLAVASARVLAELRVTLARRGRELVALSTRLMSVQEEERRRLSRELHDEFGQSLTAVNAYLWLLERHATNDPAAVRAQAAEARRVVSTTLAGMRELSQLLRPSVLDDFGLVPSLDSHLKAFAERHGIKAGLTVTGVLDRLPPDVETALYRITQEALTNVARHARARRVQVVLSADREELRLQVDDDGVGLVSSNGNQGPTGTGLVGIRERVRSLGGRVTIQSTRGMSLRVVVPLKPHPTP
jgi:signal transduction histidine kinase